VGEVLEGVDLVLIPSFFEESFSLVAAESWAHGVPVLASSRGALLERVQPGFNGWLVKDMKPESWAGMLRSLIDSGELRACQTKHAEWSVLTTEQSVQAINDVYGELLEKPSLPAVQVSGKQSLQRFHEKLGSLRSGAVLTESGRKRRCCLGIVRDNWAPANYRVRFPMKDLGDALDGVETGIHVVRDSGMDSRRMLTCHRPGKILMQPFLSNSGMRLMEALHREPRLRVTLVIDDLWTGVPPSNPVSRMIPDDVEERLNYLAMLSDALVFTTPVLRETLSFGHDNTFVIENALPEWIWESIQPGAREPSAKLRVGWAGASQHRDDLAFLSEVVEATADKADWVFLGMCPQPLRRHVKSVQAMVPFDRYPAALNGLGLDLAIAPLAVNDFNRCKSHLKLLEYGVLGIPVVAADLEPYRGSPAPLARPGDPDDWIAKILEMIENEEKRLSVGRRLRSWVAGNHMCRHRRSEWMNVLGIENDAV
jgi:glycosyltransferase involved in cell wall biosynthesis